MTQDIKSILPTVFVLDNKLTVRLGKAGDERALHKLKKQWVIHSRQDDLSEGFVTTLYEAMHFRRIIELKEIVIAEIKEP